MPTYNGTRIPFTKEADDRFNALELIGFDGLNTQKLARFTYDFNFQGGAIGPVVIGTLPQPLAEQLPANALIGQAWGFVVTAVTSGGTPSVTLGTQAAPASLLAATNPTTLAAGQAFSLIPTGPAANMVNVGPAATNLYLTISGAALTAGRINFFFEYVVPA